MEHTITHKGKSYSVINEPATSKEADRYYKTTTEALNAGYITQTWLDHNGWNLTITKHEDDNWVFKTVGRDLVELDKVVHSFILGIKNTKGKKGVTF